MVIVKVIGGLGNQMFQYAFYKFLKEKKIEVKLDLTNFKDYKLHNGFELKSIFDVKMDVATEDEIAKVADDKKDLFSKIRRNLLGRKKNHIKEEDFEYECLYTNDDIYLDGYWQSEIFFKQISSIIKQEFQFKKELQNKNNNLFNKIKHRESVSIHIRRGDYITNAKAYNEYGKICNLDYYQNAISRITKEIKKPYFIVFSNDIAWCKNNLNLKHSIEYVDWNKGKLSYIDMQLMSECKHNIIANSSFSWWGAWLNNNKNKIVIAPSKWKHSYDFNTNRVPDDWVKIEV